MKTPLQIVREVQDLAAKICEEIAQKSNTYAKMDVANACEDAIRSLDLSGYADISQSTQVVQQQIRGKIETAWQCGYYHAGYTHDRAYADQEAAKCADELLSPLPQEYYDLSQAVGADGMTPGTEVNEYLPTEQLAELLRGLEAGPYVAALSPQFLFKMGQAIATQAKKAAQPVDGEARGRQAFDKMFGIAINNANISAADMPHVVVTKLRDSLWQVNAASSDPRDRDKLDAECYRWIVSQNAEILRHPEITWTREDKTQFKSNFALRANHTQYAPAPTLTEAIIAARAVDEERK